MSKADELGTSSAFGRASGASARRRATDAAIGSSRSADASVTELPPDAISFNPDNPRDHLRDLDETVQSVREVGIVLPIIVATAEAYLKERPEREGDLAADSQYVVVDGHRRLEAARRAGLTMIDVRVDNDRVSTDERLLETAFVANYHRDDMTELEEAHALQALVEHYGSQTKAAQRLGIRQNVISSKLSVLKLAPDLQADLQRGERTYDQVRNLGKLSPEEQRRTADERAQKARAKETAPSQPASGAGDATARDYPAGITSGAAPAAPDARLAAEVDADTGADTESGATGESVPEQRAQDKQAADGVGKPPAKRFPYDDGADAYWHLNAKMTDTEFLKMADLVAGAAERRRAALSST
ncbi:ParB/RepB/Spo0J family partition protein [Streptomyces sp. NPDC056656]|uniref:ParB/RepB/Spo0J family partition protein n=1 Tax=Streptomyces sp. NPDC056656 TaxID=3345895 RepID=UPI0036D085DB